MAPIDHIAVDEVHSGAEAIERKIRARGAALDLSYTQALYKTLLKGQRRDGVEVLVDLAYGEDARHRVDVYRPQAMTEAHGAMLFMPGGGFIRGDKSERENIGLFFARQGYVVAIANYRLAPAIRWPAGAQDVASAYRWLAANADRFGIDASRIILAGESAGAAHVALTTLVRRFQPSADFTPAGAILISGVYNPRLEQLARAQFGVATPDPRNEAYFGSDFAQYQNMSTVELIDAAPFPLLMSFAELDLLQMQVQAGELFARLVTRFGFSPRLHVIRGHNHLSQCYCVNTGDEALSSPMLDFLHHC
jgi:acetyl esterase